MYDIVIKYYFYYHYTIHITCTERARGDTSVKNIIIRVCVCECAEYNLIYVYYCSRWRGDDGANSQRDAQYNIIQYIILYKHI